MSKTVVAWTFAVLVLCSGCVQHGPVKKKPPVSVTPTIEQLTYQSFQERDSLRATMLRSLKGTKYDKNRMEAIERIGAEASRKTWQPVADAISKRLDTIPQEDQKAFDDVLESVARGSERASK